jgi:prepilin peptidase CpaA
MIPTPTIAATLAFVALCVASDLRTRRIPNLLSGVGMAVGLVLNGIYFGSHGLLASGGGLLVTVALLLFPFAMGGIGGGDVKMMGAIGALLGPYAGFMTLLVGLAFGGAIMGVHLARRRRLGQTLLTVSTMVSASILGRSLDPLRVSAAQPGAITLPYSVPLGLGTIAVIAMSGSVWLS